MTGEIIGTGRFFHPNERLIFKQLDTSSKTIVVPSDMKGLRIRIPTSPIFVATYEALGAVPVALATDLKACDGVLMII